MYLIDAKLFSANRKHYSKEWKQMKRNKTNHLTFLAARSL